jgi:cytochrome c biogenesis protein CcdA
MLALLLPLAGFAFLDSLNVLNLGVTTAVVYDSRLRRRSPLPAGLSFVGGVFVATATVGIGVVLGLTFLTAKVDLEVTPTVRYWGQLAIGLVLIAVAALSGSARGPKPPDWALQAARRNPWLFGVVGLVVGSGQAVTSVPFLTALAMISARNPLPAAWPVYVFAYCAMALVPALLVLGLSVRKSMRARRLQRTLVRVLGRYAPVVVRILFMGIGLVLVVDALVHYADLW